MIRRKNVKLSTSDIQTLITNLKSLSNSIHDKQNDIAEEVAKEGLKKLNDYYSSLKSNRDVEKPTTYITKTDNGFSIVATGKDVVYQEFGTGEHGAEDGHPWKGQTDFKLNGYNTGPTIKINKKTGRHFWYTPNGKYSEGISSGKELYKTIQYLRNTGIKKITAVKGGDILSKL